MQINRGWLLINVYCFIFNLIHLSIKLNTPTQYDADKCCMRLLVKSTNARKRIQRLCKLLTDSLAIYSSWTLNSVISYPASLCIPPPPSLDTQSLESLPCLWLHPSGCLRSPLVGNRPMRVRFRVSHLVWSDDTVWKVYQIRTIFNCYI